MVLVLVEHAAGRVEELSLQALTFATTLAEASSPQALLIGPGARDAAVELGTHGVGVAHVAEHDGLGAYAPDAWARILRDLANRISASVVIASGSERGNDVMARLAARARLPLATNCTAVRPGVPLAVTRLRWGGSLLEEAQLHAPRALLTTAPHAFSASAPAQPVPVEVLPFEPELDASDLVVRVSEQVPTTVAGQSLTEAKVVVSGGRGVGSAEGFGLIEELSRLLGGAVGCSRAVTSAGWRPHTEQVGQTGTKIAPELYVACGISGATQHMAGCKGAKRILAINTDAEASIMAQADYAVIGDLHEIIPALCAEIRRLRQS